MELELTDYDLKIIAYIKRNKNKRDLFIATVEHVSSSGMTRFIKYAIIYKGEFLNVTHLFRKLDGQKMHHEYDGYKIGGCGMDMIFAGLQAFAGNIGLDSPWKLGAFQHYRTF